MLLNYFCDNRWRCVAAVARNISLWRQKGYEDYEYDWLFFFFRFNIYFILRKPADESQHYEDYSITIGGIKLLKIIENY